MTDDELTRAVCNPPPSVKAGGADEPPPAYLYLRVSTEDQARSGLGIEAQMDIGRRWGEFRALDLKGYFSDEAESSVTKLVNRPAGRELSECLKQGDHVVFPKLDRGFRDTVDMLQTVERWIDRGVIVHFCDLGIDTTSPAWLLLATVQSAFARSERDRIGERTAQALKALKKVGKRWSRRAPSGFKWVPSQTKTRHGKSTMEIAPDPAQLAQMRQIAQWRLEGLSYHAIWKAFQGRKERRASDGGEWTPESIWRTHKRYLEYEALKAESKKTEPGSG
jgi:putative DNA-invertase from lambdoid prophage Rac